MPVFRFLPVEILRQILFCLDPPALVQISLVSRLFNELAEPFLYASLGRYNGWLFPQLCAIVARPELARHVRHIHFGWWDAQLPTPEGCILFSTTAQRLGIPEISSLAPEVRWTNRDTTWSDPDFSWSDPAQALLLLYLVPDVRELSLGSTPLLTRIIGGTLLTSVGRHPFRSLVKFRCAGFSQGACVTLTMLLALMRLPSLREFEGDMQGRKLHTHAASVVDEIIAFAGQSPLTHLSLHYGNMTTTLLQHVLRMPRALTHLSYSDDDEQFAYEPASTPLQAALAVVRPSLQYMCFGRVLAVRLGKPDSQTLGVLHDWPALTRVRCSLPALLGSVGDSTARLVDVLPVRLRVLHLRRLEKISYGARLYEHWTVREMMEQVVEVLQSRALVKLTVDTDASMYSERKGGVSYMEVKRRLAEAVVVAGPSFGCKIKCH